MLDGSPMVWLGISVVFLAVFYRLIVRRPGGVSFSLHPLCPPFVNGAYAAYKLGSDETSFILSLREIYGDIVYLPFPLCQYFVLSDAIIRKIYDGTYNAQLSFIPIRKLFSGMIFGMSKKSWQSYELEKVLFPLHHRGMAKGKLTHAIDRFTDYVHEAVSKEAIRLKETSNGKDTVDLITFAFDIMFEASIAALFGNEFPVSRQKLRKAFTAFDDVFPLLSSGMIPLPLQPYLKPGGIAEGIKERDKLNALLGKWARETDCAGLEEEDVVRSTAAEMFRLGWNDYDVGTSLMGDFWALLANNPFAACWVLTYLTQADDELLEDVYKEIDAIPAGVPAHQADLPLLQSVFYETLRLQTSTFSIRKCSQQVVLAGKAVISPGESVICVTRAGHLDTEVWGEDARLWDGRRFYDRPDSSDTLRKGSKASKIPFVRAFGGGVSIVRHNTTLGIGTH